MSKYHNHVVLIVPHTDSINKACNRLVGYIAAVMLCGSVLNFQTSGVRFFELGEEFVARHPSVFVHAMRLKKTKSSPNKDHIPRSPKKKRPWKAHPSQICVVDYLQFLMWSGVVATQAKGRHVRWQSVPYEGRRPCFSNLIAHLTCGYCKAKGKQWIFTNLQEAKGIVEHFQAEHPVTMYVQSIYD